MCGAYFESGAKDIVYLPEAKDKILLTMCQRSCSYDDLFEVPVCCTSHSKFLSTDPPQSLKQFCHQFA